METLLENLPVIRNEIENANSTIEVINIPISDIQFNSPEEIVISNHDFTISQKTMKELFSSIGVSSSFNYYYDEKLGRDEWSALILKLKHVAQKSVYSVRAHDKEIISIREKRIGVRNQDMINMIEHLDTEFHFVLKNFSVEKHTGIMSLDLIMPNTEIEVITNDIWNKGVSVFNDPVGLEQSGVSYLLNRLTCANGMTTPVRRGTIYAESAKFSFDSYADMIERSLNRFDIQETIAIPLNQMKKLNLSIAELDSVCNHLNRIGGDEPQFANLTSMINSSDVYHNLYGTDVYAKPYKWQQTADSGYNAYDMLNLVTWISSHDKIDVAGSTFNCKMSEIEKTNLKIFSGDMIFKEYDMANFAPHPKGIKEVITSINLN